MVPIRLTAARASLLAGALLATTSGVVRAASSASGPPAGVPATTQPAAPRADATIDADLKQTVTALRDALAGGVVTDPAKRAVAAPSVIPLLRKEIALFDELGDAHHNASMYSVVQQRNGAMLYLFADKPTVDRVDASAAAGDPTARGAQLNARWIGAGLDADAQQPIAADLVKLDAAHPTEEPLTLLTYSMSSSAVSPELKSQLMDAVKQMHTPVATRISQMADRQAAAARKLNAIADHPLTVSETTVDGKPFTSADYKGKVVLVDFWATWCGPCKAELPRVKDLYAKYHDKGLEIVGVSNDFSAGAVTTYTAKNGMPWVELLDANAAAAQKWNPTTLGYGVMGIPTMFLIDRKGVCRTVEARGSMEEMIPKLLAE